MDKIHSQSCAWWSAMVGSTYFDNQEDDPYDHWSSYACKSKIHQNPKSGQTWKENPTQVGLKGNEDQLCDRYGTKVWNTYSHSQDI